jgi:hypothetical protein
MQDESLAIRRQLGDKAGIAISLSDLGLVAYSQGDYVAVRSLYEESLAIRREIGETWGIARSLVGLGGLAAATGRTHTQAERGARLLGAVEALLGAVSIMLEPDDRMEYEQGVAYARAKLSKEAFEKAWTEGRAMSMEQAIEYALEDSGDA